VGLIAIDEGHWRLSVLTALSRFISVSIATVKLLLRQAISMPTDVLTILYEVLSFAYTSISIEAESSPIGDVSSTRRDTTLFLERDVAKVSK
jgi:hypothetical protein